MESISGTRIKHEGRSDHTTVRLSANGFDGAARRNIHGAGNSAYARCDGAGNVDGHEIEVVNAVTGVVSAV